MLRPAVFRTFYRITRTDPPTRADFLSNAAKGRVLRDANPSEEARRCWAGVSVSETLEQAGALARALPRLGSYIVRLDIPDDAPLRSERTFMRNTGHHTLWGDPDTFLACVVRGSTVPREQVK